MDDSLKLEYNKRYESMMNSNLGMTTSDFAHFQVINFDNDAIYNVEIKSKTKVKCDCPDYQMRGYVIGVPCKHILYALMHYEEYKTLYEDTYNSIIDTFNQKMKVRIN